MRVARATSNARRSDGRNIEWSHNANSDPGRLRPVRRYTRASTQANPAGDNPFNDPAAAPKLIPVDYDPFADAPGVPARVVPVDYDPFAAPASNAGGSPALSNPQPRIAGSVTPAVSATRSSDQHAPANPAIDPTLRRFLNALGATAHGQQTQPSNPLGPSSSPFAFWPRTPPIFPGSRWRFGELSPDPLPYTLLGARTDRSPYAVASGASEADGAVSSPEGSEPAVILAADEQNRMQCQLDLFNQNASGTAPRRPAIAPMYRGEGRYDSQQFSLPPPLQPPWVVKETIGSLATWLQLAVRDGDR